VASGLLPDEYLDGLRAEDPASRYTFDRTEPDQPQTVLAVQDGAVVGFATTGPARDSDVPDAGELYAFYVDPARWGVGVGRVLIAEARARLWRSGFREAVLWVMVGNDRAKRFRVQFVGETIVEAQDIRDAVRRAESLGATEITAVRREA